LDYYGGVRGTFASNACRRAGRSRPWFIRLIRVIRVVRLITVIRVTRAIRVVGY
jgi:hypothetical protein